MIVLDRIDVIEDKTELNRSTVPVQVFFSVASVAAHDDLLASYLKNLQVSDTRKTSRLIGIRWIHVPSEMPMMQRWRN